MSADINREFDVVLGNFANAEENEYIWPEMLHRLLTSYQVCGGE